MDTMEGCGKSGVGAGEGGGGFVTARESRRCIAPVSFTTLLSSLSVSRLVSNDEKNYAVLRQILGAYVEYVAERILWPSSPGMLLNVFYVIDACLGRSRDGGLDFDLASSVLCKDFLHSASIERILRCCFELQAFRDLVAETAELVWDRWRLPETQSFRATFRLGAGRPDSDQSPRLDSASDPTHLEETKKRLAQDLDEYESCSFKLHDLYECLTCAAADGSISVTSQVADFHHTLFKSFALDSVLRPALESDDILGEDGSGQGMAGNSKYAHCQELFEEILRAIDALKRGDVILSPWHDHGDSRMGETQAALREIKEALARGDWQALGKQKRERDQSTLAMREEAKGLREMCKSIRADATREMGNLKVEISQFDHHLGQLFEIANDYQSLCTENKRLYNEVLDLKGNIRVYTRVRPAGATGSAARTVVNVEHSSDFKDKVTLNAGSATDFAFEKAFDQSASQDVVYNEVAPFIRPVLDGFNVCLFAYGQTGSGKTHTMSGGEGSERGVNVRAIEDLFQIIHRSSHEAEYSVSIQMLEIYNEQLRDLLDENQEKKLEIRSGEKSGVNVPGLVVQKVSSVEEVLDLMRFGERNRAVGATAMNERSSRSHSIFTMRVASESKVTGCTTQACLHLIDLAGSERVSRSEATGERLKEAQHINKSLSALGDVISALASKQSHIPYRNSKLTFLLADSLKDNAKVLMLSHIAPEEDNCSETVSTLHFATRVSNVTLGKAKRNLMQSNPKKKALRK